MILYKHIVKYMQTLPKYANSKSCIIKCGWYILKFKIGVNNNGY